MPLHINLYHEVQRQERARQRDPLRLGMLGMLVVAVGFVINYFVALGSAHSIELRYSALQAQYAALEPKAAAAKARQTELNTEITASQTMMKNVDSRFFWAPVLDQVRQTVPQTVQLTHMGATAPATDNAPSVLSITGISSAVEPRKEAEALRIALDARLGSHFKSVISVFKQLDDSDQIAVLDGHRLATAIFTIEFQIQAKDLSAAPAQPAIPAAHRKNRFASAQ